MQMLKLTRQRNCIILVAILVITVCIVNLMRLSPELSTEQTLSQRLAECHMRIQYLESMYRARQEDVAVLSQNLVQNLSVAMMSALEGVAAANTGNISSSGIGVGGFGNQSTNSPSLPVLTSSVISSLLAHSNLLDSVSLDTRQLLANISHANGQSLATFDRQHYHPLHAPMHHTSSGSSVRLPNAYHFLPHLLDDAASLRPAFLQSKGRSDVSIVLGIPTVKRDKQSYLLGTLQNLIESMSEAEQNETLIVVCIAETDGELVQTIAKQIEVTFESYVEGGLIDVIAPAASYYPNFDKLRITLNDPLERVKWRSKQNLDFAYLMAYAQAKGTFYVQLEDDILAKKNFITSMKKYAIAKSATLSRDAYQPPDAGQSWSTAVTSSWFILDFCQLGFIGKMFKSAELPYLITFFQMFYNDKPVDWLLHYFIETKVCRYDKDQKHCNLEKAKYWLHYRPSLFQHIGTSSSLRGKVQKLKDKQFGLKVPAYYGHPHNPPAFVRTNIAPYKNYQLKRAYHGETYFWGLLPQPGDRVEFVFERPTQLRRFLFRSGNSEHPSDRFYNTTVEVLPAAPASIAESDKEANITLALATATTATMPTILHDGYIVVGTFDQMGVAEGKLDPRLGPLKAVRLHVHGDSENWVLLSEIDLQPMNVDVTAPPAASLNDEEKTVVVAASSNDATKRS